MDSKWSKSQQQPHPQPQPQHQTASTTDPYAAAAAQFYNAQQLPCAQYRYYSQTQNPNSSASIPKPQDPSPQLDSAPSESGLHPPGVDQFTPNPYLPHGGYDGQTALQFSQPQMMPAGTYFADPTLQQSWAVQGAFQQTVAMANAVIDPNTKSMWKSSTGRQFGKSATKKPKKVKVVQSAWCEICRIECNSKDVLDKHKMGKKHKKNLEKIEEANKETATAIAAANPSNPVAAKATPGEAGNAASGQATRRKAGPGAEVEDLETKRRKLMESGAAAESLRVCAICNVAVNSETVFNYHLAGQKHAAQLKKHAAAVARAAAPAVAGPQVVTAS